MPDSTSAPGSMPEVIVTARPPVPLPFWLPAPCPAWCGGGHDATDPVADREHVGSIGEVDLTLEQADWTSHPETGERIGVRPSAVAVALLQHVTEAAPQVELVRNGQAGSAVMLTTAEASQLAGRLLAAVAAADGQPALEVCPSWCVMDHPRGPEHDCHMSQAVHAPVQDGPHICGAAGPDGTCPNNNLAAIYRDSEGPEEVIFSHGDDQLPPMTRETAARFARGVIALLGSAR